MKTFDLVGFAAHLAKLPVAVALAQHEAMARACHAVETEAKASIGHYQDEAGPFVPWADLAENTLWGGTSPEGFHYEGKIPLGYATEDDHKPELRDGNLRNSIGSKIESRISVAGVEGQVGSDSNIMIYQELGTDRMPPRSILGGAAVRKTDVVLEELGSSVVAALCGVGHTTKIR